MKLHVLLLSIGLAAAGLSHAQSSGTNTPTIDQRQANQQKRIDQGVASGELNKKEAARLEKQQARVAKHEAAAKADGVVTPAEKRRLTKEQNHASRAIAREKHDKQHAK